MFQPASQPALGWSVHGGLDTTEHKSQAESFPFVKVKYSPSPISLKSKKTRRISWLITGRFVWGRQWLYEQLHYWMTGVMPASSPPWGLLTFPTCSPVSASLRDDGGKRKQPDISSSSHLRTEPWNGSINKTWRKSLVATDRLFPRTNSCLGQSFIQDFIYYICWQRLGMGK